LIFVLALVGVDIKKLFQNEADLISGNECSATEWLTQCWPYV